MKAYSSNREEATEATLEADMVATAVTRLVEREGEWSGTTQQLLSELNRLVEDDVRKPKGWPEAPNALSRRMNRIAPMLKEAGIEYSGHEEGHSKRKIKTLKRNHHDRGTKNVAPMVEILPENRPDEDDELADIVFGSDGAEDAEKQ